MVDPGQIPDPGSFFAPVSLSKHLISCRASDGAGSGIRTHEGVTPNGCHVDVYSYRDLEAVALTAQPSRRNIGPRLYES